MIPEDFNVSVIIPVHNRPKELIKAIESVLGQTFQRFEIIVVDDFSSIEINPKIFGSFNNYKIIRLSQKENANVARNIGAQKSEGKFIAFLDSDDQWKKNHLEQNLKFINEKNLDGVFGGTEIHSENSINEKIARKLRENELFINYLFDGGICQTSTFVLKKSCFDYVKFNETLERHQDWDFGIRFNNSFTFKPIESITVVVNWKAYGFNKINLKSCKKFIDYNKSTISRESFFKYHRNMYHLSKKIHSKSRIKKYFLRNALIHFNELSKTDFMSIYNPSTFFEKIYYNLVFIRMNLMLSLKSKFMTQ